MSNPTVSKRTNIHYSVISAALAENTRIAYQKGWRSFCKFCSEAQINPLSASPEVVADFLVQLATQPSSSSGKVLSMGTVSIYRSAVNSKFQESGRLSPTHHPTVNSTVKGLARIRGTNCRQVRALREHEIKQMINKCGNTPIGKRDAAILAVGFAGALRRSEICSLTISDIEFVEPTYNDNSQKLLIYIRKSKTDQEARGHKIAIPEGKYLKPIERLQVWLGISEITHGHVFQTMRRGGALRGLPMHHSDIPRLVKHYAALVGLDPSEVSGHSLRAGFVTSAAIHRARLDKIMEITRHSNPTTVMKYIRDADLFSDHAGKDFL